MKDEHDALREILDAVPPPEPVDLPLHGAAGYFALEEAAATLPLPAFDNSAMDGYALHAADCGMAGHRVAVCGSQPAGADAGLAVAPGRAVRIFTGAPLPAGTAAVLMQEDADAGPGGDEILIRDAAAAGEFIRRAGSDLSPGTRILTAGDLLTPERLAVLASQGRASVRCGRRPRVSVICTGSELVPPGRPLPRPGYLYNSNGTMLVARLRAEGFPSEAGLVPDDPEQLARRIAGALEDSDVVVLAAGVSVGDHDLVVPALASLGISPQFHRVRIRPGKPLLFARRGRKLIFGLPGNPVSAAVSCALFVLPALRRMSGATPEAAAPRRLRTTTTAPLTNPGDRPHYVRGTHDGRNGTFEPSRIQESHALFEMSRCNALLRVDAQSTLPAGSTVECIPL